MTGVLAILAALYIAVGIGCWNVLWTGGCFSREARHLFVRIPAPVRLLMVFMECAVWPVLLLFGLWTVIYERRTRTCRIGSTHAGKSSRTSGSGDGDAPK